MCIYIYILDMRVYLCILYIYMYVCLFVCVTAVLVQHIAVGFNSIQLHCQNAWGLQWCCFRMLAPLFNVQILRGLQQQRFKELEGALALPRGGRDSRFGLLVSTYQGWFVHEKATCRSLLDTRLRREGSLIKSLKSKSSRPFGQHSNLGCFICHPSFALLLLLPSSPVCHRNMLEQADSKSWKNHRFICINTCPLQTWRHLAGSSGFSGVRGQCDLANSLLGQEWPCWGLPYDAKYCVPRFWWAPRCTLRSLYFHMASHDCIP